MKAWVGSPWGERGFVSLWISLVGLTWSCQPPASEETPINPDPKAGALPSDEVIDPYGLEDNDSTREQVLRMSLSEAAERLGSIRLNNHSVLELGTAPESIEIREQTELLYQKDGSYHLLQRHPEGYATREAVFVPGHFWIRNGTGAMRVQRIVNEQPQRLLDDSTRALAELLALFGKTLRLKKMGSHSVDNLSCAQYGIYFRRNDEASSANSEPTGLKGSLCVHEETGVLIDIGFEGTVRKQDERGTVRPLAVRFEQSLRKTQDAVPIPKDAQPEIQRPPPDPDPLAFMKGQTRTSTVIGGGKRAP
jgi:hypothetical protein